jgi:hypothetical protein
VPLDFVIKTGDQAIFNPAFPPVIVAVQPGIITGTGVATNMGSVVCIQGDESSVVVPGVPYTHPAFGVGVGTLTIEALNADQIAQKTQFQNKPAILKGTLFTAKFTVVAPASSSSGVDGTPSYSGTGQFQTSNSQLKGT